MTPIPTFSHLLYTLQEPKRNCINCELTARDHAAHRLISPFKLLCARWLCQCNCNILQSINFLQHHPPILHNVTNKMILNIKVFRPHMKGWVLCQADQKTCWIRLAWLAIHSTINRGWPLNSPFKAILKRHLSFSEADLKISDEICRQCAYKRIFFSIVGKKCLEQFHLGSETEPVIIYIYNFNTVSQCWLPFTHNLGVRGYP